MPRGDKTGPDGNGPKTGRGLGDCEPQTETERTSVYERGAGNGNWQRQGRGGRRDGSGGGRGLNRRGR